MLSSCSGENLYDFEELSKKDDFIIEVFVRADHPDKPMDFSLVTYKTDGFGRLLESHKLFGGIAEYEVINNAVKEYKKVGVTFLPGQNVARLHIRIYNLETGYVVCLQQFEEVKGEVTIYYDFETAEETVLQN